MEKGTRRLVFKSSFGRMLLTMSTNIILAAFGLVTGSLAARFLGPTGRGELAVIQTWPTFLAGLAGLGLSDAVVYFSSKHSSQSGTFLATAVALSLMAALPAIIIGNLLLPLLLKAQTHQLILDTRLYLTLFIPLMATQGMLLHPLRGQNNFFVYNLLKILNAVGWFSVILIMPVFHIVNPNTFAYGYLAISGIIGILTWFIVRRYVGGPYVIKRDLWRPMLNYGLPSAISFIPQYANLRLDQLVMAMFLAPDRLGYYVVAVAWSGALLPVLNGIGAVLFPRVAMEGTVNGQVEALGQVARSGTFLSFLLSILLLIITPFGIRLLFGTAFEPSIEPAIILVFAANILSVINILEEGMRGLGNTKAILWSECVGVVVTVIGLIILLPRLEIIGAAIASFLGYCTILLALLFQLKKISQKPIGFFLWPKMVDLQRAEKQIETTIGVWIRKTT